MYEILNAECMDAMQGMEPDSIDAIVTDPPYGLAFMGAKWDSFNGSNGRQTTKERQDEGRRYAAENKGAPRYGNSHGKRVTRDEMMAFQEAMTPIFAEAMRAAKPGAYMLCFGGTRTFHRLACAIEDAGWTIRDTVMWVYGSGFPHGMDVSKAIDRALDAKRERVLATGGLANNRNFNDDNWSKIGKKDAMMDSNEAVTEETAKWDGWNTQLKPAWEPIIVAQKPLDGTVAHNVMAHGTGAINIDGCRVPTSDELSTHGDSQWRDEKSAQVYGSYKPAKRGQTNGQKIGRFPANLVHDGSEEVLGLFPNDSGRFFYCAKASKSDRNSGGVDNDHNTVKPNKLMRYLVRMVCRKGGTVLDPFMGSGSTGVACMQEGMSFIGIDMDEHYCEIAEKRIASAGE